MLTSSFLKPLIDVEDEKGLPRKFRIMEEIQVSGSAQFSEGNFEAILEALNYPKNLYVIDLRNESHAFINGQAITWFTWRNWGNRGLKPEEAQKNEHTLISQLQDTAILFRPIHKINDSQDVLADPIVTPLITVRDEKTLVESKGAHYIRLHVVDHEAPTDEDVATFTQLIKSLPEDAWVHIHCRGGAGRTTTFCVMAEILKSKNRSLEEMVQEQHQLGGSDLFDLNKNHWKLSMVNNKMEFIKHFYDHTRPPVKSKSVSFES